MKKYSQLFLVAWLSLISFLVFTACGQTAGPELVIREASTAAEGNAAIYLINADGRRLTQLTDHTADTFVHGWSPDGQQLALSSSPDGILDIYVMNADGRDLRPLTQDQAVSTSPVWSPNGQQIAFTSRELADYNDQGIYVINPDGSGRMRLTENLLSPNWLA